MCCESQGTAGCEYRVNEVQSKHAPISTNKILNYLSCYTESICV